jgi:alkylhydroperoxidase family enzyme
LRSLGGDDTLTVTGGLKAYLLSDYSQADIGDLNLRILEYAEKITREAHMVTQDYLDDLKQSGLDDTMLHDIVQVTAYFNYINRLADALGVELEEV